MTDRTRTLPRPRDPLRSGTYWLGVPRCTSNRAGRHYPHGSRLAEVSLPQHRSVWWINAVQEFPGPVDARDQASGRGGYENPNLCSRGTEVHDMDRRWYSCWLEHLPEGRFLSCHPTLWNLLTNSLKQMWVSADEWHEDPEIIHRKFA